ncbi:hypothetical protein PgNI_06553 [Pyricularia grisea]|uniref:Major facilitator superfamily (MFS) profile domain-containing protein n=1 Tax=Pyricularia grisea TaxID=148305 RepID=A0A6P8B6G3_PYRGI|nr:hypothetical protein PgNI_06553 [Pyricularia grisea]TLD10907.1 hypothetical protein PgNI_06553 [Pyricularia grisea]
MSIHDHVGTSDAPARTPLEAQSTVDLKHWWRHKNLRALNLWLIIPLLSIFSQGFDGSMMNGLQSVTHWRNYFGTPTGATLGIFNAAYPLGGIVGVFFISPVADRWGRRWGLCLGAVVSLIGAVLQAASQDIAMFVVSRLLIGAGSVIVAGVGAPWITEIAHPSHRATATALFLTSYSLGSICAGWTTFGTFRIDGEASWRIPSGLQGLPNIIQLAFVFFVPESPRWLVSKGRQEEALTMLVHYHGEGNEQDPVVRLEYEEITQALHAESEVNSIWAVAGAIVTGTPAMFSWFTAIYFATLPEKLGRRVMFLCSLVAMWIVVICITAGSAVFASDNSNVAAGYSVVVFLYLFSPAYNFGFNGNLGLYIPEILPYHMRTSGLSFFYFVQFSFMILSTFAVPVGLESIQWRLYTVFVAWIVVQFVVVYLVFPETKGHSLEEISNIFEGPPKLDVEAKKEQIEIDLKH